MRKVNLTATVELLIEDDNANVNDALKEWRSVFGGSFPGGTADIDDIVVISSEVIAPSCSNVLQLRPIER